MIYDRTKNKFVLGDCMDLENGLPSYPDNYFDLAIVDPQYGIKQDGRKNHTRGGLAKPKDYRENGLYDDNPPDDSYFTELLRVSKNQIIFGGNYFKSLPHCPTWIIWDKQNGGTDFADFEMAWTSFPSANRIFRFRWNGMIQGDMKNKEIRIHPNQKPVRLYQEIIRTYFKYLKNNLVLDTHVGSGSSLLAFESLGINYHAYEINKFTYKETTKRIKKGVNISLF